MQTFVQYLEQIIKRNPEWFYDGRSARLALAKLRANKNLTRSEVTGLTSQAYQAINAAGTRRDMRLILDIYDLTAGPRSASPTLRTFFTRLPEWAEKQRSVNPKAHLRRQFDLALGKLKNEAYHERNTTKPEASPLHTGVTQLFFDVIKRLPRTMNGVDYRTLQQEVEDVAEQMPQRPSRESIQQTIMAMDLVLNAIRPKAGTPS